MTFRIKIRRDTAEAWAAINPILADGEIARETDTGRMKYGNGTTAWNDLAYYAPNLERARSGWVASWGERYVTDNQNEYWWESVAADTSGIYLAGADEGTNYATVVKIAKDGTPEWRRILNDPDGYEGDATDVKIDPTDGNVVVLNAVWNNDNSIDRQGYTIHKLNANNGDLVAGSSYRVKDDVDLGTETGDIYARELAIDSTGAYWVFGSKYGDNLNKNVTALGGSTTDVIFINYDETFAYPLEYSNSYIKTQDNVSTYTITGVNRYTGLLPSGGSGSNLTVSVRFKITGPNSVYKAYEITDAGSGYVNGETVTILGSLIGGSDGVNDWTATLYVSNPGTGVVAGFATDPTWTPNRNQIKITCNGSSNDFSSGNYKLFAYTNEEAYIAKHHSDNDWTKIVGEMDNQHLDGGVLDSNNNAYAVGEFYNLNYPSGSTWQGLVVKLDSAGILQWARSFDIDGHEGNTTINNATVDSDDRIILVQAGTPATVTKITDAGTIVWQKKVADGAPISMWNATVDVDSDDNIYLVVEMDSIENPTDDFLIVKFNPAGDVVWQRTVGSIRNENSNWSNGYSYVAVKEDKIYICGSSEVYANPRYDWVDRAFVVQLTTDGDFIDYDNLDIWQMKSANWNVDTVGAETQQITTASVIVSTTSATVYTPVFGITAENSLIDVDRFHKGTSTAITNATSIEFEGGHSIGKTGGRDIPPIVYNGTLGGNYYLGPHETGRFIWLNGMTTNAYLYVPSDDVINMPVGTVFTVAVGDKDGNSVYVQVYGGSATVYAGGQSGSGNWELASNGNKGTYTIMKVTTGTWMVSGPDVVSN